MKLQEQEFFAQRSPEIANAPNAAVRKKLIAKLPAEQPQIWQEWCHASRKAEGESQFVRQSQRYPLCGKGDVNTYALFAEHNCALLGSLGRAGFIVPAGIVTDDSTKDYFSALVSNCRLGAVYHFENENRVFPGVHHAFRFVLLAVGPAVQADLVFFLRSAQELADRKRHFSLSPADFALLNPNTRTCPTFRSRLDADLNLTIYRRAGVLWREGSPDENPWELSFMAMIHMANDSGLFRTRAELEQKEFRLEGNRFVRGDERFLPLLEAKMLHHFDHRFGTYEGQSQALANQGKLPECDEVAHQNPLRVTLPMYWVPEDEVLARLDGRTKRDWFLIWRKITGTEKQRTVIACLTPKAGAGDSCNTCLSKAEPKLVACLYGNLCSLVLDYTARQKVGGTNLVYHTFKQFPQHHVEAALCEHLGELKVPVEESVLCVQVLDGVFRQCWRLALTILYLPPQFVCRSDLGKRTGILRPYEGSAPGIGGELLLSVLCRAEDVLPFGLLAGELSGVGIGSGVQFIYGPYDGLRARIVRLRPEGIQRALAG